MPLKPLLRYSQVTAAALLPIALAATQEKVVLLASADGQTLARAQQRSLLGMAALAIALNVLAIVVGMTRPRWRFFTELDQAS